jgi:hypothetical protein
MLAASKLPVGGILALFYRALAHLSRIAAHEGFTEGAGRQPRHLTEGLSEVA